MKILSLVGITKEIGGMLLTMRRNTFLATVPFMIALISSLPVFANSTLFTLVTIFTYPKDSGNYIEVQGQNQLSREECETQVFLLSDNKNTSLPFGRSNKWEVIGGEAKLKDGEIVISKWDSDEAELSFFCAPTGWGTKLNS